jgi:hypothetical protein
MPGELVECHSGFTYPDRPVALVWEGRRQEIVQILAEWLTPGYKYFRVCITDGRKFELAYNQITDEWKINNMWRLDAGNI